MNIREITIEQNFKKKKKQQHKAISHPFTPSQTYEQPFIYKKAQRVTN